MNAMSTPDKWIRLVATFTFLTGTSFNALAICDVESKNEQAAAVGVGANSEAVQQKRLADMLRSFTEYGQKNRDELRISIEQKIAGDFELRTSGGRRSQLTNLQLTICMLNAASQNSAKQNDTSTNSKNNSSAATDPQQNQSTQQQSQQAQQQAQQAQEAARVAQTRADQARQGQRRRHEPENEASQCIQPDFGGLYGGMKNTCDFKVWYTYCGYRPKESSWLTGMSCE